MEAPQPASSADPATSAAPAGRWMRAGVVACGCALAAAAVHVAVNDPSAEGARFLPCMFHRTTGLWCPGCGLTRGAHALFQGDVPSALGHNLFTPLALVGIVLAWGVWALRSFGRQVRSPIDRMPDTWARVLLVSVIVYGVLRNIPVAPLTALAP